MTLTAPPTAPHPPAHQDPFSTLKYLLLAMRPKQWTKNGVVFVAGSASLVVSSTDQGHTWIPESCCGGDSVTLLGLWGDPSSGVVYAVGADATGIGRVYRRQP